MESSDSLYPSTYSPCSCFDEIALIPMYLLIGVWGSGRKEYAAMKLTLMLMGGSAFLLIGILGIYFRFGSYHHEPAGNSTAT